MSEFKPLRNRNANKSVPSASLLTILLLSLALGAPAGTWAQAKSAPAAKVTAAKTTAAVTQNASQPQLVDAIIAVVNNEVITQQELEQRLRTVQARAVKKGINLPPRAEFQHQLLEQMVLERAQMQLAKEAGIQVDDIMLDRSISRIAEQNKMTLQKFRDELEREGTAFPEFREEIRQQIVTQRLREREVDSKIQVAESEIDNYLGAEKNPAQAQQELNLAQILVRIPENASPEQIAEREKRAQSALQQLKSGGDFAKVSASFSDAGEALTGGDLGWRGQDRLPKLFLDAVANLSPGQVSAVLRSANGFHILKLVGKRDAAKTDASAPAVQQTHARHILIKVNQAVPANEARRTLTELKQRLDNKAATFEELAKLYSNDLSAAQGGDLGWLYPGDTVPEFERAMDALQPGQISEPIESPFGYHLIQVLERKTDAVSPERKRNTARMAIREIKIEEATQDWQRQIRDRAYVEFRTEEK
ncbi:MAG: molecular chaperone SurA [Glaciimonas sp.]|nr:molecular chaperone SurA [Glaciimonas sp.]